MAVCDFGRFGARHVGAVGMPAFFATARRCVAGVGDGCGGRWFVSHPHLRSRARLALVGAAGVGRHGLRCVAVFGGDQVARKPFADGAVRCTVVALGGFEFVAFQHVF